MSNLIETLQNKRLVWRGVNQNIEKNLLSTGFTELDEKLSGGFDATGIIEIISDIAIGEFRLLMPSLLAEQSDNRLQVLIAPPGHINAQMMSEYGINLSNVIIINPSEQAEALWAAEQCLKSGCCSSVVSWLEESLKIHQIKRLQIAAEKGNCKQFIYRSKKSESIALPVDLSLSLIAEPQGLTVKVNKRKRGWPLAPFTVNFTQLWPELSIHKKASNVIPLVISKTG